MRILITGGLGWTARAIIQTLHNAYHEVSVLDVPSASLHPDISRLVSTIHRGNIAFPDFVNSTMQRVDMVVHLAVAIEENAYMTPEIPFQTNILGTYNVFEAAYRNGVSRVILMSSAPIHLEFPEDAICSAQDDLPTSAEGDHLYDLTKRLQEQIGKDYAATFGLDVITLRAGHIVDSDTQTDPQDRPLTEVDYCRGGWVCRYDLGQAVLKAIEFEAQGYHAFNIISDARAESRFDLATTENVLGMQFEADFSHYPI